MAGCPGPLPQPRSPHNLQASLTGYPLLGIGQAWTRYSIRHVNSSSSSSHRPGLGSTSCPCDIGAYRPRVHSPVTLPASTCYSALPPLTTFTYLTSSRVSSSSFFFLNFFSHPFFFPRHFSRSLFSSDLTWPHLTFALPSLYSNLLHHPQTHSTVLILLTFRFPFPCHVPRGHGLVKTCEEFQCFKCLSATFFWWTSTLLPSISFIKTTASVHFPFLSLNCKCLITTSSHPRYQETRISYHVSTAVMTGKIA